MITRIGAIFLALALFVAGPAAAQDRDRALESVRALTETLIIKVETGEASEKQVWAAVQGLTDAMRRFSLMETEVRADEKVAPPASAFLRPGEEAPVAASQPGEEAALSDVPLAWFTAQMTQANAALNTVRTGVEERVPPAEMATRLRAVHAALVAINHPPI